MEPDQIDATDHHASVLTALRDEADALAEALRELPAQAWDWPTRCDPWRVRELVGHVITALARVPEMVSATAPDAPDTSATGYYRADERFNETANADRVSTARERAAVQPDALVRELADTRRAVAATCEHQPANRIVRTRHGDAMLLVEFLTTRVVEVAVHGIDIADAVHRPSWLTDAAADQLQEMLFGPDWRAAVAAIGWDPVVLVRKATGRAPVDASESTQLDRWGMRRLALG